MWSKNRGVDITPVVTKVSVGASEIVALLKVSNLVEELKKFKDAGYAIVTAEVDNGALSLFEFEFPEKTVLVLGSEGEGITQAPQRTSRFPRLRSDVRQDRLAERFAGGFGVFIPLENGVKKIF